MGYAPRRMRWCAFPAAVVSLVAAAQAQAQSAPATPRSDRGVGDETSAPEQAVAREHFERALTWYRTGKYRRAIAELGAALERDPQGKDLVFNLALVQEKLGDLEGAVRSLQRFQAMEKDPKELERAGQTIERLQGARAELQTQAPHPVPAPLAPSCAPKSPPRGRFDAWVIGSGTLTIASFLVGTVLGVRALTLDQPGERGRARDAALLADFAFATSLLAGGGTFALYFGRTADAPSARSGRAFTLPAISMARWEIRY